MIKNTLQYELWSMAKASGQNKYESVRECGICHKYERYTATNNCVECTKPKNRRLITFARLDGVTLEVGKGKYISEKKCHLCEGLVRYVKNNKCVGCAKIYQKRADEKDRKRQEDF